MYIVAILSYVVLVVDSFLQFPCGMYNIDYILSLPVRWMDGQPDYKNTLNHVALLHSVVTFSYLAIYFYCLGR